MPDRNPTPLHADLLKKLPVAVSPLAVTYKMLSVNRGFFDPSVSGEIIIPEAHTPTASVKAVIAAHLPEDSACGMSYTYC
jgi:hypothetical protein